MVLSLLSRIAGDRGGNFGLMTAILLPVLVGAAGVAIDVTNALQVKNQLQGLVDSTTLATASAMSDKDMTAAEANAFAKSYFLGQAEQETEDGSQSPAQKAARLKALSDGSTTNASVTNTSGNGRTYNISMTMNYDIALTGLSHVLGLTTMNVSVSSTSQSGREGNALSMYLALDESGSMAWDTTTVNSAQKTKQEAYSCGNRSICYRTVTNYITKMQTLKAAAAAMFSELKIADPQSELIRVGADSYDDQTKAQQAINWGTTDVARYVKNLPDVPDGGTDATGAMTNAFNALKKANTTEASEQAKKKNTSFERFIVLMTDGEMTGNSANWNSSLDTKVRALCKQSKDDGIKIYAIAFMAPDRGKSLLSTCATSSDYYYEPDDMTGLIQSFGEIARKAAKTDTRLTN
ncbi:VWA domain-containing protein [Neorhizobium lilium]|uniref:VWA domain-containing protein n=1 Tax=Neorhizobium lilium TaxID=2503024 RepID=A0A444LJC0_9HYPH|nr:TadE/TadG family type IV pilus assembly protein [Neorhizobium lilium]RWX79099.1 VWA domain-containing protein [Neorhizobium lilium]